MAIARLAEIPPWSHSPQLSSNSRRHPAAHPSLGLFILSLAHFPLPAQRQCHWLQDLQGVGMGRRLLPLAGGAPVWHCHQPANPPTCRAAGSSSRRQELILPALEPVQRCCCCPGLLAGLLWGPVGAGPLNKMFVNAGHLFSSSFCGTGLPEGTCLHIPAKVWGKTVQKWLKHSALL